MTAPSVPSSTTLATDGLKDAGIDSPDTIEIARAKTWLEECKNDIGRKEKKLKSLYAEKTITISKGKSAYSLPTDFWAAEYLNWMEGDTSGTSQAGTVSSLTLAADESITENEILGKEILITSGTGLNSLSQVTSFASLVAGVEPDFATAPITGGGNGYLVINKYTYLPFKHIRRLNLETLQTSRGQLQEAYIIQDDDYGELRLRNVPDATAGLRIGYYMNLLTMDLSATRLSNLYQKWRTVFLQKILVKQLQVNNDDTWKNEKILYQSMIAELIAEEVQDTGEDSIKMFPDLTGFTGGFGISR